MLVELMYHSHATSATLTVGGMYFVDNFSLRSLRLDRYTGPN